MAICGCAQPVAGVWPPQPGEAARTIVVSTDAWHSVIGLVQDDGSLEEWGYADRAYYLDGRSDLLGILDAMFLPGEGAVQTIRVGTPLAERSREPPVHAWRFRISERGWDALTAHLAAECAGGEPIDTRAPGEWRTSSCSYHGFHHCHHFTASALREAGLPVWSLYALFPWGLRAQLDRAEEMQAEADAAPR